MASHPGELHVIGMRNAQRGEQLPLRWLAHVVERLLSRRIGLPAAMYQALEQHLLLERDVLRPMRSKSPDRFDRAKLVVDDAPELRRGGRRAVNQQDVVEQDVSGLHAYRCRALSAELWLAQRSNARRGVGIAPMIGAWD